MKDEKKDIERQEHKGRKNKRRERKERDRGRKESFLSCVRFKSSAVTRRTTCIVRVFSRKHQTLPASLFTRRTGGLRYIITITSCSSHDTRTWRQRHCLPYASKHSNHVHEETGCPIANRFCLA